MEGATNQIDENRFLEELDNIAKYCASIAQEYALLRGAMNSLDGLKGRFPDEDNLSRPAVKFFNETLYLRQHKLIGVVWALSERASPRSINASSLSSDNVKNAPTTTDQVKFAGDMTLMRMRDMYRRAISLHPDILLKKARSKYPIYSDAEIAELASEAGKVLLVICNKMDAHLSDDDAWHKVEYFRHLFAHSLQHPLIAIKKNWTDSAPEYSYNELYVFGDRAAHLAIDFNRAWSFSRNCSGVDEMVACIEKDYSKFWDGFFNNPHFLKENV